MKQAIRNVLDGTGVLKPVQRFRWRRKLNRGFVHDFEDLQKDAKTTKERFTLLWKDRRPHLFDKTAKTGFDRHYVYHPAWAARILSKTKPHHHVDISSTLYFSSIVSAFIPILFYDYRPAELILDGLDSGRMDLTNISWEDNSVESLSCMHTVEHIGLGRYGDPIDYDGDLKAMKELSRVLAVNGNLLFVVPIGRQCRIVFNAHRVYTADVVLASFNNLALVDFSLIPEDEKDGGLVSNPSKDLLARQDYGCGCFWFKKKRIPD